MASLYPKKKSPFWYIRYRCIKTGLIVDESTKLRRDNREQTRQAKLLEAEKTAEELQAPSQPGRENWRWVSTWILIRYANSALTRTRYEAAWFALHTFFEEKKILCPRHLQREHCFEYLAWRQNDKIMRKVGLRTAKHNTALLEIKFLSGIMKEAVERRLAAANPCLQLGIGRVKGQQKPDITPREEKLIEKKLAELKDVAMSRSWQIAMLHGRRLSETCVELDDVNLDNGTITFRNKGGDMRTKLLHPELVPLFTQLKREGARRAFEMPKNFSKRWKYFFKKIGLPHLSFHSTRVTVVNKLRDQGVDKRDAMDYVDHSSEIVHRSYEREKPIRQLSAVNALSRKLSS